MRGRGIKACGSGKDAEQAWAPARIALPARCGAAAVRGAKPGSLLVFAVGMESSGVPKAWEARGGTRDSDSTGHGGGQHRAQAGGGAGGDVASRVATRAAGSGPGIGFGAGLMHGPDSIPNPWAILDRTAAAVSPPAGGVPFDGAPPRPGVALLPDLSEASVQRLVAHIARHRRGSSRDRVVVSVHWGGNWVPAVPQQHRAFARRYARRSWTSGRVLVASFPKDMS